MLDIICKFGIRNTSYLIGTNFIHKAASVAIFGTTSSLLSVRALVLQNGNIIQITDALLGTKKPLKLSSGVLNEDTTAQPTSVILSNGQIRCYDPTVEQLIF